MFFSLLLIFLFPLLIISKESSPPQLCNSLFVSRFVQEIPGGNLTVSANLKLIPNSNNNFTTILISNATVEGNLIYGPPKSVCVNVDEVQSIPPPGACATSLNASFNFTTKEPSFDMQIYFPEYNFNLFFYFGFADNGTFGYKDGTYFSIANATFIQNENQDIFNQTCTSFIPAPVAPSNSSKCKTFQSQILILNITDNYSIFAKSYMTFNLSGNQLDLKGNYTIPNNLFFDYIINDGIEECDGTGCNINLKSGDKKLIISAAVEKRVGFDVISFPIPMIGRIIFRGNQILMGEGISFSPKNDCLYFNFPYSDDQVATNKFCCTQFEDF